MARRAVGPMSALSTSTGTARHPTSRWPFYDELAGWLAERSITVVTVPGPNEMELCGSITNARMLTEKNGDYLDFFKLAGIIQQASFVVGNDTGPMHIVANLGKSGLALYSSVWPPTVTARSSRSCWTPRTDAVGVVSVSPAVVVVAIAVVPVVAVARPASAATGTPVVGVASGRCLDVIGDSREAKGGVNILTKSAAAEYGAQGIRINAVCPGVIQTEMAERLMQDKQEVETAVTSLHPMGRLGTPEEIAETVVWLSSNEASFVTGQALAVDGGYVAQ